MKEINNNITQCQDFNMSIVNTGIILECSGYEKPLLLKVEWSVQLPSLAAAIQFALVIQNDTSEFATKL